MTSRLEAAPRSPSDTHSYDVPMAKRRTLDRDPGLIARMTTTVFLLGLIYVIFFVVLAQAFNLGLIPIILLGGGMLLVQYWTSDKIALASSGAKIVSQAEAPELHAVIQRLCMTAGLPMPRVAIVPTDMPNAFATGRSPKHAAVAVTQGLLDRLEPDELEGVIAHELSHIAHRDVAIMTIASFFAMVAGFITRWGFFFGGGFGGATTTTPAMPSSSCSWCRSSSTRSPSSSSARSRGTASSQPTGARPSSRSRRRAWRPRSSRSRVRWAGSRSVTCAWPRA